MTRSVASSTLLALVFSASGAFAAVTPEEVWESWQAFSTAAGQELTVGSADRNGDTLEVSDLVMIHTDDLGGSFTATIDRLAFKDNGDGTVAVTMSESYPLTLAFPTRYDGISAMKLTISQPGLVITAGGSVTEMTYDFNAPDVTMILDEVKDETGTVLDTDAIVTLTDTTARYSVNRAGDAMQIDSGFSTDSVTLTIASRNLDGPGDATASVVLSDLNGTTKGNFLMAEVMANMANALKSGFTADSSMSFGQMKLSINANEAAGPTNIDGSATGGDFVLAIDKERLDYSTSLKGASFSVSGAEIPFPKVTLAFAETGFKVLMPVSASNSPQDFAFVIKLMDFTVSEDIWGLFDPAATLSREPATIILDTKGTGRWLIDMMDPAMERMDRPGELNSLDLTQLLVKAAGTELGATGALTFDNTDLATLEGVPAPTGSINVNVKGVNKLIDNLIAIGLLPDDQAMGFRMMLGLFTRPGAGPDEVTSVIEFKDGGLFANGQQLQ